ncbi:TPA: lysozyme inhibitor LprI family protein [Pseudomonas aeruginosa]
MNKPLATALLATSSLLLADGAPAADACGTPRNAFDSVYCRSGEFSQADRELNQQFGTLRKHLNDGQKALLKKSQIAWIKERDAACSESKDNGYFVNLDCATEKTRQRLDFLRERERECLSTGCVDAKL